MRSPKTNPILQFPENQPKKRSYGRLYVENQSVYTRLAPLAFKIYGIACLYAWRDIEPLGVVPMSLREFSKLVGSPHKSVIRAIPQLVEEKLISYDKGKITVLSYWCPVDTTPGSTGPRPGVERTPPLVSSGHQTSLQPQLDKGVTAPSDVISDVYQTTSDVVAAGNGHKKTRKSSSWLIWDSDEERLVSRPGETFQKRRDEFMALWFERLGNEEAFYEQLSQADQWLKRNPNKRGKTKRFDTFFSRWLDRCLEG